MFIENSAVSIDAQNDICVTGFQLDTISIKNSTVEMLTTSSYMPCFNSQTFIVDNSNVILTNTPTEYSANATFITQNFVPRNVAIVSPAGAVFDETLQCLTLDGVVTGQVVIKSTAYDLWVAGVQVTPENKDDLTAAINAANNGATASGTITYEHESKILTLEDVSINSPNAPAIRTQLSVDIELVGENSITTTNSDALVAESKTYIWGDGSLNIESVSGSAIFLNNNDLYISVTTVTASGAVYGIYGTGDTELLEIYEANVRVTGTQNGSIANIGRLAQMSVKIIQPEGAEFSETAKAVVDETNQIVKSQVVFEAIPIYDIYLCGGVRVNEDNKDDLATAINDYAEANGYDATASGTITYDPETNTLTLDNATINTGIDGYTTDAFENWEENLTIKLIGKNVINAYEEGIMVYRNATINGDGQLKIDATNGGIGVYYCNLTIENTTVITVSDYYGIYGVEGKLTIDHSTVRAKGYNYASIAGVILDLVGCDIISPAGATFDSTQKAVVDASNALATEVLISSGATAIETLEMPAIFARDGRIFGAENARIYDVLGRDVTQWNGNLKGVYVVKFSESAMKIVVK